MGKHLTNFEKGLKEAYDKYEAPYDSSSWNAIRHQLNVAEAGSSGNAASMVAAVAATLFLVFSSAIAYYSLNKTEIRNHKAKMADNQSLLDSEDIMRSVIIPQKQTDNSSENITRDNNSMRKAGKVELNSESIDQKRADVASGSNISESEKSTEDINSNKDIAETGDESENSNSEYSTPKGGDEELSFAASLREACVGVSVSFELTSEEHEGSYLWNFGDGNFSNKVHPTHVYKKPGVYDITLSVTSHEDGVIRSRSLKNLIIINPVPEAKFEWDYINDEGKAPRVKFINLSERAKQAAWTLGNQGSNEINPELTLATAGEYPVKLVVSNEYGCVDSVYNYITVEEDYRLLAPQYFSPNRDGVEDTFMPEALKLRDVKFELSIYEDNQMIFRSIDKNQPWDGVLPNGTVARPGQEFPWVVIMTNENGTEETYSGTITVMP